MGKLKFVVITLIVGVMGFLSSCKDDDNKMPDPVLNIGEKVIELGAIASDKPYEIAVTSNYEWKATRPEADTWCVLKQEEKKLLISLISNVDTLDRKTRITIISGNEDSPIVEYIDLIQKTPDRTSLVLSVDNVTLKADGDLQTITALANTSVINYTYDGDKEESWCVVKIEGNDISISAEKNEDQEDRGATLIFTAGEGNNLKTAKFEVVQKGQAPYITFSRDTIYLDQSWMAQTVEVLSNREWEYSLDLDRGVTVKRVENALLINSLDPYYDMKESFDRITVKDKTNPNFQKKIVVILKAAEKVSLKVDQEEIVFKQGGSTQDLNVTANYPVQFTDPGKSWLTIKQNGNKLSFETSASADEQERKAVVTLVVGAERNKTTKDITIVQYGTKPALSVVTSVVINENGDAQEVAVAANGEWTVIPVDADWLKVVPGENKITFSATRAESSRSVNVRVVTGAGNDAIEKVITVVQNKLYKVGDVYVLNGKNVGLVYAVSDGGMHGKVVSLAQENLKTYRRIDGAYDKDFYWNEDNVGPTNENDGNENVKMIKQISNWKHYYPVVAWCDELNDATGNPGWYLPAFNELAEFCLYFTGFPVHPEGWWGVPEDATATATALQQMKKVNKIITDAGGEHIVIYALDKTDTGSEFDEKLYSSTEEYNGSTRVKTIYFARAQLSSSEIVDKKEEGRAARAIFKF